MAATYHWPARHIERELTDELLILYLDEEVDRVRDRAQADFDRTVEAVRVGTIFAHDGKQHARWVNSRRVLHRGAGLTGDALEAAVRGIAAMFPGNVERVTA